MLLSLKLLFPHTYSYNLSLSKKIKWQDNVKWQKANAKRIVINRHNFLYCHRHYGFFVVAVIFVVNIYAANRTKCGVWLLWIWIICRSISLKPLLWGLSCMSGRRFCIDRAFFLRNCHEIVTLFVAQRWMCNSKTFFKTNNERSMRFHIGILPRRWQLHIANSHSFSTHLLLFTSHINININVYCFGLMWIVRKLDSYWNMWDFISHLNNFIF